MDSFELNKIIGAVLGTLLFIMGVGFIAEAVYEPIEGRGPGYELPEPEPVAAGGETTAAPEIDLGTLMASASVEDGAASARKCQSCHNFDDGGPNGQGPNLYGIVDRPVASHPGFSYSDAMKQHAADIGNWTYEEINKFITAPKDVVKGTKMNFGGVKDPKERANILAFLSTLSPTPVPFPAPAAPTTEAPAADAAATPAEAAPAETPTTTQSETPVEGTATGSNTPAGAETPAAGGTTPATPAETPAMAPADAPAMAPAPEPTGTMAPAPAPTGTITPAPETPAPAASTTTTTTAQ